MLYCTVNLENVTDSVLEKLWEELGKVPINEETECLESAWRRWPAGTHREDVWRWFDEHHSKGVVALMKGGYEKC